MIVDDLVIVAVHKATNGVVGTVVGLNEIMQQIDKVNGSPIPFTQVTLEKSLIRLQSFGGVSLTMGAVRLEQSGKEYVENRPDLLDEWRRFEEFVKKF